MMCSQQSSTVLFSFRKALRKFGETWEKQFLYRLKHFFSTEGEVLTFTTEQTGKVEP